MTNVSWQSRRLMGISMALLIGVQWSACSWIAAAEKPDGKYIDFTAIPEGVTSLGAAIVDDYVYTYGGHTGAAHEYCMEDQSNAFRRLKLAPGSKWEELPGGPRLQGLALVAHGGKVYRIGGFSAHNKKDEAEVLKSVADVARFDPKTKKWEALPPLPQPRSSLDAVVEGDKIYVVGGWQLRGDRADPVWHDSAYELDLSAEELAWKELPKPPIKRRALSVGAVDGKIYAVGGIQPEGGITMQVHVFDPKSNTWSEAPALPGEGVEGFGTSAFAASGTLFVSNVAGKVFALDQANDRWVEAGKLKERRLFHRMLTTADQQLLIVGGAEWMKGKANNVYIVPVTDPAAASGE